MPNAYTPTAYPFIVVFNDATVNPTFALTVIAALAQIAPGRSACSSSRASRTLPSPRS